MNVNIAPYSHWYFSPNLHDNMRKRINSMKCLSLQHDNDKTNMLPSILHHRRIVVWCIQVVSVHFVKVVSLFCKIKRQGHKLNQMNIYQKATLPMPVSIYTVGAHLVRHFASWSWHAGLCRSWCVHGWSPVHGGARAGWCLDPSTHTQRETAPDGLHLCQWWTSTYSWVINRESGVSPDRLVWMVRYYTQTMASTLTQAHSQCSGSQSGPSEERIECRSSCGMFPSPSWFGTFHHQL